METENSIKREVIQKVYEFLRNNKEDCLPEGKNPNETAYYVWEKIQDFDNLRQLFEKINRDELLEQIQIKEDGLKNFVRKAQIDEKGNVELINELWEVINLYRDCCK